MGENSQKEVQSWQSSVLHAAFISPCCSVTAQCLSNLCVLSFFMLAALPGAGLADACLNSGRVAHAKCVYVKNETVSPMKIKFLNLVKVVCMCCVSAEQSCSS